MEDYIIGYLGESRLVKELIREFLERRSQARQKREPVDKDVSLHPFKCNFMSVLVQVFVFFFIFSE